MNDKTKTATNDTASTLYVVGYKYVHKNGAIRVASYATNATSPTEAQIKAAEELNKTLSGKYKITSVKPW